jgi:uncharacterized protein (TIGR02147 family)
MAIQNDIFEYTDYRKFVRDFFQYKKQSESKYSLETLARKVGLSKMSIKYIMDEKRHLSTTSIQGFCDGLNLKGASARYFQTLVRLNKSRTESERIENLESLMRMKCCPLRERVLKDTQLRLFQNWYHAAIVEMSYLKGFRKDAKWIQSKLKFTVPISKIRDSLQFLEDQGLLDQQESNLGKIKIDSEIRSQLVKNYNRQGLKNAETALLTQSDDDRKAFQLMISVNENQFEIAKKMIADFRHQLHDTLASTEPANRLVQINMDLFTIAKDNA